MEREQIVELCHREVLDTAAALFGTMGDALELYPDYEGCQNLVYSYEREGRPRILRISFRPDRPAELIQAELDFISYLADHGAGVARPLPSRQGRLLETVQAEGIPFHVVTFERGRGTRVPDNGYRYREGVPIEQYFQDWGQVLGRMHALSKDYEPISATVKRPPWSEMVPFCGFAERVPDELPAVREKCEQLMARLRALPRERHAYGLIHGDFNDGNFTLDYDTGEFTVFDFDDACYCWYVYELACAWESGVGRTMFRGLAERQAFMEHYFEQVMEGYNRENSLDIYWLDQVPLFLKVVEMLEFLHFAQYYGGPDEEIQARLRYKIACIEDDIPYLGFFDPLYSPERPFLL